MWWLIGSLVALVLSLGCGISTAHELSTGKTKFTSAEFWGAVVFHGGMAILAVWLFFKGMGWM
ncbi:MAG: hypothetical protein PHH60_00915 [Candidatus Margulisbacteria bacterium]|nr:hypothetical protein [Candidatus Margulisiibacteriota bacterium]